MLTNLVTNITKSPILGFKLLTNSEIHKEDTINHALLLLEALYSGAQAIISELPDAPQDGELYLIMAAEAKFLQPYNDYLAYYFAGWHYYQPLKKIRLYVQAQASYMYYDPANNQPHWQDH